MVGIKYIHDLSVVPRFQDGGIGTGDREPGLDYFVVGGVYPSMFRHLEDTVLTVSALSFL